jgi:hypothetical protein
LLWLFWRWGLENYLPSWPETPILPISASQVTRITGGSHWRRELLPPFICSGGIEPRHFTNEETKAQRSYLTRVSNTAELKSDLRSLSLS